MNRAQYVQMFNLLRRTKTKYAECIRITRTDGEIFRFTVHDNDIVVTEPSGAQMTYTSAGSFTLTNLEMSDGLAVSNMDIDGLIDSDLITESDLRNGVFDHAQVDLFLAYWSNSYAKILPLRKSWIGEMQVDNGKYKADLRGLAQKLAQQFIKVTSLECRYDFCDAQCQLDESSYTDAHEVTEVASRSQFYVTVEAEKRNYYYQWGKATWVTGANAGLSMEVLHHFGDRIQLFLPMRYSIEVGDTLNIVAGCSKTWDKCKDFGNGVNFGGEPFLAGSDMLTRYPDPTDAAAE